MGEISIYGVEIVELGVLYRDEIELDGYHFDIISTEDLGFETITPNNQLHSFMGYNVFEEIPTELPYNTDAEQLE